MPKGCVQNVLKAVFKMFWMCSNEARRRLCHCLTALSMNSTFPSCLLPAAVMPSMSIFCNICLSVHGLLVVKFRDKFFSTISFFLSRHFNWYVIVCGKCHVYCLYGCTKTCHWVTAVLQYIVLETNIFFIISI